MLKERIEPVWIDYPSAERYSGLSHTTLWRYVTSGDIRAARIGRSVRIYFPSLQQFMQKRQVGNKGTIRVKMAPYDAMKGSK